MQNVSLYISFSYTVGLLTVLGPIFRQHFLDTVTFEGLLAKSSITHDLTGL